MEIDLQNEKQKVNAYAASLKNLNEPMSGNLELLKEGLSRNIGNEQQLKDLLSHHGYTFGQPDSLQNNLNRRLADLMEDFRAKQGTEAVPQRVRCTFEYSAAADGKTETYSEEIPYVRLLSGELEPVQIEELYRQAYQVKILEFDGGHNVDYFDRYDAENSFPWIGANSWEEAYDKFQKMIVNETFMLDEGCRWTLEEVDLVKEEQERREALQSELVDRNMKTLWKVFPDGMTIHLPKEDVGWVASVRPEEIISLTGSLQESSMDPSMDYGTLRAEIRLEPMDYSLLEPADAADRQTITGGYHLLDNLFIEGVPLRTAQELVKSQAPANDKEFKNDVREYLRKSQAQSEGIPTETDPQQRISDICFMDRKDGNFFSKFFIRCKIDGEQQSAVSLHVKDRISLSFGRTTKEELAVKYFRDELDRERTQEQDRSLHR